MAMNAFRCAPWLILAAALWIPSHRAAAASEPFPHFDNIQMWDATQAVLEKRVVHVRAVSSTMGLDSSGRSAEDYADQYLLSSEDRAALNAVHTRALAQQAAGDTTALREALKEGTRLVAIQIFRLEVLARYWSLQESLRIHRALLQPLLDKSSETERARSVAHIQQAVDRVPVLYFSAMTVKDMDAMRFEWPRIAAIAPYPLGVYNEERERLAAHFEPADLIDDSARLRWVNTAPCTRTASRTSGITAPRLDTAGPAATFYPETSRRAGVEGNVIVKATVTASGCLTRIEVYRSSGAAALDEAAVKRISSATFYPAEKDHLPIDATAQLLVRFRLTNH